MSQLCMSIVALVEFHYKGKLLKAAAGVTGLEVIFPIMYVNGSCFRFLKHSIQSTDSHF